MIIQTTSGSARAGSSNVQLLTALPALAPQHQWPPCFDLGRLPLFQATQDRHPWPEPVLEWRAAVQTCDVLVISTPEYLHNLPAALKNALEWLTSSGELASKRVLPITLTPHAPRGERAMQSLCWSLQALEARVVTQLALHHEDLAFDAQGQLLPCSGREFLEAALEWLD